MCICIECMWCDEWAPFGSSTRPSRPYRVSDIDFVSSVCVCVLGHAPSSRISFPIGHFIGLFWIQIEIRVVIFMDFWNKCLRSMATWWRPHPIVWKPYDLTFFLFCFVIRMPCACFCFSTSFFFSLSLLMKRKKAIICNLYVHKRQTYSLSSSSFWLDACTKWLLFGAAPICTWTMNKRQHRRMQVEMCP